MADAFHTLTTHVKFVPEIWAKDAQVARENSLRLASRVDRFDLEFSGGGNKLNIPLVSHLAAGNISVADGSLDATVNTETEVEITVDKWKGVIINIVDITAAQASYDLRSLYTARMGYALALAVDDDLQALYDSLSASTGTAGTDLSDAQIRAAVQALDEADAPMDDRHACIAPSQKNAMLAIDKFTRYDALGQMSQAIRKGIMGEIYGVDFGVSNNVVVSGGETKNMMWHRSALALAMVKDIKMEEFARIAFSQRIGGSELYGVAITRNDHAVKLKS